MKHITKIQIIFYSMYGHIYRMAEAVGASTLAGPDGSRWPSENELAIARSQGKHVAGITKKLAG